MGDIYEDSEKEVVNAHVNKNILKIDEMNDKTNSKIKEEHKVPKNTDAQYEHYINDDKNKVIKYENNQLNKYKNKGTQNEYHINNEKNKGTHNEHHRNNDRNKIVHNEHHISNGRIKSSVLINNRHDRQIQLEKHIKPRQLFSKRRLTPEIPHSNNDYEMLLKLDEKNYDKGNGFSPIELSVLPSSKCKTESKDHNCVLCLEIIKRGEYICNLPCFHSYHESCIKNWLQRKKKCPECNKEVELD